MTLTDQVECMKATGTVKGALSRKKVAKFATVVCGPKYQTSATQWFVPTLLQPYYCAAWLIDFSQIGERLHYYFGNLGYFLPRPRRGAPLLKGPYSLLAFNLISGRPPRKAQSRCQQ